MIVIYERDAVDFSTNGLGTLAPQSCLAEETMNGGYEVTLVHPLDEAGKYKKIQKERILRVPVPAASTPRIHVGAAAAASRDIYRVVTDGRRLNIRAAPDNGKIIGSYKPGTEVVVIDRESNDSWSEVTGPDGKHGWMWTGNLEYVRTETTGTEAEESIKEAAALRDQPFRIYKVVPTLTEITVYARHIFYDLMDNMVSSYTPTESTTGAQAIAGLSGATEEAHGFTFYSDLDTTAEDVEITDKNPAEAILDDGGLIEAYGGELMRDWWDVYLVRRVGSETGLQIREGKNLLGISYSEDMTNVVTRIIPRGEDKDGNKLYLPERYIENTAEDRPTYAHHKWRVLDVKEAKEKTSGDEKRTKDDCYKLMREAAAKAFEEGCDYPDITLDVNFIDCAATEEYRQYRQLQSVHMGDTVRVQTKRSGISAALRMTHYIYNCLTKQYEKMTLGTADATIEGNMINPSSIGSGTIKGSMLAQGSVGAGAIQDGAVNSLKIALAAIGYAHIGQAAIGKLAVDAVNAVRADIRKLVAGEVTADQLYADLAAIAVAQITTANIKKANIEWAEIAKLTAAIANIANAQIGTATIDYAKIVDAVLGTAIITKGVGGKLFINRLAVTDANMVSLAVGALMVKAEDGSFKQLVVGSDGNVTGKTVEVEGDNIAAATIPGGKLIENTITARELNVGSIFADEALIRAIKAANIDVADLFAAKATITALDSWLISTSVIQGLNDQLILVAGRTVGGTNLVSLADGSVYVRGGNGSIDRTWSKESYCQSGVGILMYPPASGNYNCLYFDCGLNVAPGEYTLSFYCWTDFDGAQPVIRCNLNGEGHDHYFGDVSVPAWTPTRMTVTFSADYEAGVVLRLLTWSVFTGNILITDVKLETGNTATAWSPYPGDPAGELDTGTGGGVQVTITKDRFNVNVPGADGDFELNETGGVLPVLRSKYVESPNLAYAYDGPATITVNPAASSNEIAAGGVYKSLPEALAALNNRQLAYDVTINVMGDSYGFEELYGVHGSQNGIVINGNGKTLIGRFRAVNCSTNIAINGLTFAYDSAYGKDYAVNFDNCSHVDLKNCVITGNKLAARGAWFAWGTRAYLEACEFYDVTDSAIRAGDNVDLLVMNAKGSADYYLWANGATIKWGGTRPAGLYYEDVPSICTDLTNLSVDYGSATPEITTPVTAEYPMLYADSYAGGFENSWDYQQHNDIMQGYTEHAGRIYGCIWFDNAAIRAAVAGKTVKQASIRLTAQRYVGRGVAVEVHLYGTTTEYAGRNGPPVLVNYDSGGYGVIGMATPGETTTISIPIEAAADLASGAINGLVLYSDDKTLYGNRNYSRNYMRFDGSTSGDASTRPVLTVVYQQD